jgi:hypothetical protein
LLKGGKERKERKGERMREKERKERKGVAHTFRVVRDGG